MAEAEQLDYILADCFLAVGQAVGTDKAIDFAAVTWWHDRYRRAFHHAMNVQGASWSTDRDRVTAVGRYLGQRVVEHSGTARVIETSAAARASDEVERGCQLGASREATLPTPCTTSAAGAI
ncbi:MAG: hypothetical protein OXG44_04805 [Gammaproteobacteria bacterium]|nr:hypothetical protein [Gammaproteobacteria bacterium]